MKRFVKNELIRYMIVGGGSALVDATILWSLTYFFKVPLYPAFFMACATGVLVNFTFCNLFVFGQRTLPLWRAVLRHYTASAGGIIMQTTLFFCVMTFIKFPYPVLARIGVAGCTFIINFLIIRRFVFGRK